MSVLFPSPGSRAAPEADPCIPPSTGLAAVFAQAPVGMALLDLSGRVTDVNEAFLAILGADRKDVLARPFIDWIAAGAREDVNRRLTRLVLGTSQTVRLGAIPLTGGGDRSHAIVLDAAGLESDGEVCGLILSAQDPPQVQPAADEGLVQAQKMHAIGQLAGGIAHDFNNLLTAMIGFSDLLLHRHRPGEPSHDDLMQIRGNALRAAGLVRQLLAFSRQQALAPVVLDPAAALRDLASMLARLLGPTIELRLDAGAGRSRVRVDAIQFDQIIVNLAVNARDAMPNGGVVTIRTGVQRLDVAREAGPEVMPVGDYVRIDVTDTGVGIAEDILSSIFDPFFTTKDPGEGTGLGLSTVYGIVRQSEGFIFVDSEPGSGTTFSISLPLVDADADADVGVGVEPALADPAAASASAPALEPGPSLQEQSAPFATVLLVDDEPGVRAFAAKALRRAGYRVLDAADGEDALALLRDQDVSFDLLISDVVMPGMDGPTLVRLLGERPNAFAVIFMSGYAEDVVGGSDASACHFLMKPFSLPDLVAKVGEALAELPRPEIVPPGQTGLRAAESPGR